LRLSHDQPIEHPNTANIELFAQEVEERSGGSITVEIYPAAQLFDEETVLPALQRGEVDMGLVSVWETLEPASLITDLPFRFSSWDEFHAALDGEMGDLLRAAYEEQGVYTVYFQDNTEINLIGTRDRIIHTPADIEGLRIRSFSEATSEAIALWGAAPTQIPGAETYTAVERGTVDAIISGVSFYERNWYEVTPYLTQIPVSFASNPLQMNLDTWNSLSAEQQQVITEAAEVALADNREQTPLTNVEAYTQLKDELTEEFYIATDDEIAQWQEATQDMEAWYLERAGALGEQILESLGG
jgi:C4-dicarboxylate-binding protein DctP